MVTGNLLVDYYLLHRVDNFFDEAEKDLDCSKQESSETPSGKPEHDWQKILDKVIQL